jgi:hypothetical protein
LATALLVTGHLAEAQQIARRGGAGLGSNRNARRRALHETQTVLPGIQTGAQSTRAADPFDEAYKLVADEVSRLMKSECYLTCNAMQSRTESSAFGVSPQPVVLSGSIVGPQCTVT